MKKNLCMTTLAAMLAGGAAAETGVTLFGVIDTGLEVLNNTPDANGNASRRSHLNSGNLWGSRWGLRGREDLGGGLQAIYHLESGFDSDTGVSGQNGRLFGRGAYVGLAGKSHQVTLGRRNNTLYDYIYPFDPTGMAAYSALTHDAVLAGRADNVIRYDGQFQDLEMTGLYSFGYDGSLKDGGEMAGAPRIGRELGIGLRYAPGALAFGLAFDQRHGTSHASQGIADRRLAAGVSYSSGSVISYFGYRWFAPTSPDMSSRASNLYWGGLKYQATPAFSMVGMSAYTDTRGSAADPLTFALLGTYDLSKRSSLYLLASYASNRGGSNLGVNGFDEQIVSGSNQTGVIAGILHQF
ncbi:MAG: porin [Collimonas pratensis]|uniref:porin n=1 Tax=Collimonas pratensis TaxID=279113 RepID=UPI003C71DFC9